MIIVNETVFDDKTLFITAYSGAKTQEEATKEVGAYVRDNVSKLIGDMIIKNTIDCLESYGYLSFRLSVDKAYNVTTRNKYGLYFNGSMWSIFVRLPLEKENRI